MTWYVYLVQEGKRHLSGSTTLDKRAFRKQLKKNQKIIKWSKL